MRHAQTITLTTLLISSSLCMLTPLYSRNTLARPFKETKTCTVDEAVTGFSKKIWVNPFDEFTSDPYLKQTDQYKQDLQEYLHNTERVCALRYVDDERIGYELMDFQSRTAAEQSGFIVTHQGRCGACSTVQDLVVYLLDDLTDAVRSCALKGLINKKWSVSCIEKIGFTHKCAQIWYYNTLNTRRECYWTCMWAWIRGEGNNKKDGTLSDCIQCDEDKSGPVFKFESGRTRRNSGIHSEIDRPDQQVYDIDQCYF